ncbi:uncharacterized protein MCYG_08016 [Microsporum canis CBS 113480]|uniref:Uncharacterized protein n=1 Tax=Arthroderma otae (strain ATCC MYA-4605 / CBS 113480) TaxID=554155 RepID=C5FZ94_ARTOC|nr:uncharacterized protein MCYG_08016 [Microsporum canis CBS 113480]EEQ35197.1 predicted protein [Microsporum canis CBS 113480]
MPVYAATPGQSRQQNKSVFIGNLGNARTGEQHSSIIGSSVLVELIRPLAWGLECPLASTSMDTYTVEEEWHAATTVKSGCNRRVDNKTLYLDIFVILVH